jgi:hypothetical protein
MILISIRFQCLAKVWVEGGGVGNRIEKIGKPETLPAPHGLGISNLNQ